MNQARSKAELFDIMRLGPVWELRTVQHNPSRAVPVLSQLRQLVATCRACDLCEHRVQTVFSAGVEHAPLMVIGEMPGAQEEATGCPLVGRAGQLFDQMLHAVGASRAHNVYITNALKCRPPADRNPKASEIEQCSAHLYQQIQANQPKVLLLLGQFAAQILLNTGQSLSQLRGQLYHVTVNGLSIPAIVTYHPDYLLKKPEEKSKAWDDLLLLQQVGFGFDG